jgi:uncharacterized repeat protein (TIGR01451 family)/CSLREA domain-containing protein
MSRAGGILAALAIVLLALDPSPSLAAKPGGGGGGTACSLVPVLHELSIGQGLPYPVLVRGKEILARAYLSRPQCSDSDDIIDITAATLTMTGGGTTLNVGPTPTIGTTYPQLAPFTSAPAQDHTGDPKFVVPASATVTASTVDRYTASFSLRIDYRSRTASAATPVSNFIIFPLPSASALTATIEKKTAALRVLVQPLGDPTQAYSNWFTDADRTTMQNAMTTLSRIFPVPDGTGDLTGTTGGVRYTINPSLLDIRSVLGSDGKWCGTELNWTAIKSIMAQHLQSWNTANPNATVDVVVGAVSSTRSNGGSAGCAEAMSIPGSSQMWVRSIPDERRAPSISGSLLVMEMAHYLRVVPETRDAFGDAFHSPYLAADGTNPNRGYNVFGRSYLADDRSVMLLTGTGWNNTTTLMERDDFAAILCQLGGATTNDCGVSGAVGTTTGVGAGPRFVMSGRTNGTVAGTAVVESYFTSEVAPTQPDPASAYRLQQYQGSTLLRDDGVPVIFAESEHGEIDDMSPAEMGVFAISLPASTAANRIQLVHDGVVLYERIGTVPPQIVTTTRLQKGEIVNYTEDISRDDTDPALTNDGKWVAWEAPVGDFVYVHVAPASDVGQAVQLGPPGEPITSTDPAWCGNGSKLAYVDGDDIYTIDVDTRGPGIDFGTPFLLYDADEIEPGGLPAGTHPTWSPDCSELAFEASSDIWKIDADGTGRTALTSDNRSHNPSWSQTTGDDRIAYQREAFYYEIGAIEGEIVLASHPGTGTQFTVNSADDVNDGACDAAHCSLREAINAANGNTAGSKDSIHFAITGTAPFTIAPTSELPTITQPLIIDGTTQPEWVDAPIIELDGTDAGPADGLTLLAGDSTIRGLVINRFIGNVDGGGHGILIASSGGNTIEGNFIGTDAAGTAAAGNTWGVYIDEVPDNVIGGTTPSGRNLISGNVLDGITVGSSGGFGADTSGNLIRGNYVGTDVTGSLPVGNENYGVVLAGASGVTVGGTSAGEGNVISANLAGIGLLNADDPGNTVQGNLIGTDWTGSSALGNRAAIEVNQSSAQMIGGSAAGAGNVVAASTAGEGILVFLGGGNTIQGNWVGTNAAGDVLGNAIRGIAVFDSSNNLIGGSAAGAWNSVANNGSDGIEVQDDGGGATGNTIRGNSIHSNGSQGIDLAPIHGQTPNDADDVDGGANLLQNYPVLTAATTDTGGTDVDGSLDSAADTAYTVEFFGTGACDTGGFGAGFGEGETFLGSSTVTTDASGVATFAFSSTTPSSVGDVITATATDPDGNTSEFSECRTVTGAPAETASWVVNTTDDTVDPFGCGTTHCSLREAISRANATLGTDTITFDIPGTAPHVIAIDIALPPIVEAVVIDASTEPDFVPGTNAPVVQLDGAGATNDPTYGLVLRTGASTIRGFSITNFRDAGIRIESNGNAIEGNYIGVEPDGVTASPNGWGPLSGYGVIVFEADSNAIGRADGIETLETNRNIISGNDGPGVGIFSGVTGATNNTVENNYIGTNAGGTAAVPNGVTGVVVSDGEQNSIGGMNPGTGNVISGNAGDGVTIIGDSDSGGTNFVQQNRIGTNASGTAAVPNDGPLETDGRGVLIVNAPSNTIGGANLAGDGVGNLISGNATDGVEIQGALATANSLTNNVIGLNATGNAAIPNGGAGIEIVGADGAVIGGIAAGAGNVISANLGDGISVLSGVENEIVGNAISGNDGLGIDLAPDDVTANDAGDADSGANNLQNFPVIESVSSDGTTTTISGYVEDVPEGTYDVHFYASPTCDGSGNGEGGRYLGMESFANQVAGDVNFTFASDLPAEGDAITATATDADGNTSEFSACATVAGEADLSLTKTDDPDPVAAGENLTYGITVSNAGPVDATNVIVTDVLSEDVVFEPEGSATACSESAGTVTCTLGTIEVDASAVFAIVVVPQQSGPITNEASVAADQADPDAEDNSDSENTTVLAADWEIWTLDPADADATQQQLISNGTQPSWGTDDQIAFTRNGAIWLVAGDGAGAAQIADTGTSDSSPALGGRVLGFQRTIGGEPEDINEDVMLVREAEVITVTAQVAVPDNARFDIFFDCGGPFFPMAVGLPPDAVTDDGMAKLAYTYDSTLSCGSGTPTVTAVVSDGVYRSDAGSEDAKTEVSADPKPPVVAIYSPIEGQTLLQFDVIAAHGWGKDPEDGQLADSRLSWTLTGPGGVELGTGTGHAVDFQPPSSAGWTPSAVVGGIPHDDYAITLTGTDSDGNTASRTHAFAILADADRDNLHAAIDRTDCSGTATSADNNAANAFALPDPDGDGIPNSDDRFTAGGVCTAEHDFGALINFDPDEFNIPATGKVATVSIRVPYKAMSQVNGDSVRITEIGGTAVNITQIPRGWSLKDGVGVAKFDRVELANFFEAHGMVGQRVTIVVEGASKGGVSPSWSFEGIDSTMVKRGS